MNALKRNQNDSYKRLLNLDEACSYISQGRTNGRTWLNSINAGIHFGRRVVYDKTVIDKVLDCLVDRDVV